MPARRDVSQEQLLNELKDFYKLNNRSPKSYEVKNPTCVVYYRVFKTQSWNYILTLADLPLNHSNTYDYQESLNKLKDFYIKLGKLPSLSDFKKHNFLPSYDFYHRNFGGYVNACFLAGIRLEPISIEEKINKSIEALIDLSITLQRCPTVHEYESLKSQYILNRRALENNFGLKYNDICKKFLSYEVNHDKDIDKDTILNDIKKLLDEFGSLTFKEAKKKGLVYSYHILESKCGMTYMQILSHLGYNPVGTTTITKSKDEMLNDFNDLFLKLKRIPSCNEIDNTNNMSSWGTYIKHFDSIKNVCNLLNIDYEQNYSGHSLGRVAFDKLGNLCKSLTEQHISNYLIDNNIVFDKKYSYKNIFTNDKRIFDWVFIFNGKKYYVEYFGIYDRKSSSNINKIYNKKTKKKIKDLYKVGLIDSCVFIFPWDIKNRSLDDIFNIVFNDKKI